MDVLSLDYLFPAELRDETYFWTGVNVALVVLGYAFRSSVFTIDKEKRNKHDDADLLGSYPIFPLLAYYSIQATLAFHGDLQGRWYGINAASTSMLVLYVVRQFISFPFVFTGNMSSRDKVLMTIHHILSIVAYGSALINKRMHWFACMDGCCEVTTFFLNNMLIMKAMGKTSNTIFTVNGIALWLAFIVFRMILFPYWLWVFWNDSSEDPAKTWDVVNGIEKYVYPITNVVLLAMSTVWFIAISKGMLKAVGLLPASSKKKTG